MTTPSSTSVAAPSQGPSVHWGDVDDEDYVPPPEISGPDKQGIKTVVEYRKDEDGKVKVTRKIKVTTRTKKVPHSVAQRANMKPFGQQVTRPEEAQTILSKDDIYIDDPKEEAANAKRAHEDMLKRLATAFAETSLQRELAALNGGGDSATGTVKQAGKGGHYNPEVAAAAKAREGLAFGSEGGKYVAPSRRGTMGESGDVRRAGGGGREMDENTLRVTNISEEASESDLRDLFRRFGPLGRVFLATDREGRSRGFAYVSYQNRHDAEAALNRLDGFGYSHLILHVEWAQSQSSSAASENVMKYSSGYGKALPQG